MPTKLGDVLRGRNPWIVDVHHISYERIGRERFDDLMVICRPCHTSLHRFIDRMASKGHDRTKTMAKLSHWCRKRIETTHRVFGSRISRID